MLRNTDSSSSSPGPHLATLQNTRIVLVGTTHSGNIGAAARAMKTMGLERLYLVRPRTFPSAEASARASGADDLLSSAVVCESLEEALSGCLYVAGASARSRSLSWPQLSPQECARTLSEKSQAGDVALVFGRESSGLSNAELDYCQHLVQIPCNPEFSSLNLAAAVQVLVYEIYKTIQQVGSEAAETGADAPAPFEDVEGYYRHLELVLTELEFLDENNPRHLMRHLRRLYNRINLSVREVNILRGILTACQRHRR